MSDSAFRADAAADLPAALAKYGYRLSPQELALVLRFRRSLADAGVDLDLVAGMGDEQIAELAANLQHRMRRTKGGDGRSGYDEVSGENA